jgi:AraC-like DNA-binding protein
MKSEFHVFAPHPPLDQFVQFIWISKGTSDPTKSKVLPNGSIELILNFGDKQLVLNKDNLSITQTYKDFWIAGFQHEPIIIQSNSDTNLLGIRFLPGGAWPFFRLPINEFSDQVLEADWLKQDLSALREKIGGLSDFPLILHHTETYLMNSLDNKFLTHQSVKYVLQNITFQKNPVPVSSLIENTGYSHKHFLKMFREQVGTTPKNLQRVIRLQGIIQAIKGKEKVKWTDILYAFPFYDQAHFLHDFRQLAGMTPEQYLSNRTFDENHCVIR